MKTSKTLRPSRAVTIEAAVQAELRKNEAASTAYDAKLEAAHKAAKDGISKCMVGSPSLHILSVDCRDNGVVQVHFGRKAFALFDSVKKLRSVQANRPPRWMGEHRIRERVKRKLTQLEVDKLLSDPVIEKRLISLSKV